MHKNKIIKVEFANYLLYDKINTLAIEYSTTVDFLINIAVKKLIDDVELVRKLRMDNRNDLLIHCQDGQK